MTDWTRVKEVCGSSPPVAAAPPPVLELAEVLVLAAFVGGQHWSRPLEKQRTDAAAVLEAVLADLATAALEETALPLVEALTEVLVAASEVLVDLPLESARLVVPAALLLVNVRPTVPTILKLP